MKAIPSLILLLLLASAAQALRMTPQEYLFMQAHSDGAWAKIAAGQTAPSKREGHSMVVSGDVLYVFGGKDPSENKYYQDFWSYNTATNKWTKINGRGFTPSARAGHASLLRGDSIYIHGGKNGDTYYDDIYIYDISENTWREEQSLSGNAPSARAYHSMNMDQKTRFVIFGGETSNGYSDETFVLDFEYSKWEKIVAQGDLPTARSMFSMDILTSHKAWIFGGYTDSGSIDDVWTLDLNSYTWQKVTMGGTKPYPRRGHKSVVVDGTIYIVGGCNVKINTCYQATLKLNTESLQWDELPESSYGDLPRMEQFTLAYIGAYLYTYGGGDLDNTIQGDVYTLNTGVPCPYNCNSPNGQCKNNERCECNSGYFGNGCTYEMKCKSDCNGNGDCQVDATCKCHPGYFGEACSIKVECPGDCTSTERGTCQIDGTCKCNEGYSGTECEEGDGTVVVPDTQSDDKEEDDSSNEAATENEGSSTNENTSNENENANATTNTESENNKNENQEKENETQSSAETKTTNDDDSTKTEAEPTQSSSSGDNADTKAKEETKKTTTQTESKETETETETSSSSKEKDAETSKDEGSSTSDSEKENETSSSSSSSSSQKSVSSTNNRRNTNNNSEQQSTTNTNTNVNSSGQHVLTPEMFGENEQTERSHRTSSKTTSKETCKNSCNSNGICQDGVCYCSEGFYGDDCSSSQESRGSSSGIETSHVLKFALISFGVGAFVGIILIIVVIRKGRNSEFSEIREDDDEE